MNDLLLRQAGFSELACQFAGFIDRINQGNDELIPAIAALLTDAVSQGHVCLNLAQITGQTLLKGNNRSQLQVRLKASLVVGTAGDYKPLILTDDGLLYLYRYWSDEQLVAKAIQQRCQPIAVLKPDILQQDFADWRSINDDVDWQKIAVLMALTRQFSVISGGPGTGKTTIVLRLLKLLYRQDDQLNIALVAPTGKAAARLQQAVADSGQSRLEAKTVHRLLGITANNDQGRYTPQNPLAIDVLIVDEASMIDISLMAKLLNALPDITRIIILGDSQQLASVESGAVLANLCDQPPQFSKAFIQSIQKFTDMKLIGTAPSTALLSDSVVLLQHSYRFDEKSDVGQLAKAVQSGSVANVYKVMETATSNLWQQQLDAINIQSHVFDNYKPYFDAVRSHADTQQCLQLFEQYRVLSALKVGPQSVSAVNGLIERQLQKKGWKTYQDFYNGRPIMVTQNDYRQRLFNGDTGLILEDPEGVLRACFISEHTVRWVDLSRLPAHETAFAITIHKSQGSEFDKVSVLLPEEDTALLNRELLYTAITRAKKQVTVLCSDMMLAKTVQTQHRRETGLAKLLS
jgi:exodeoxyribonuclease V alpha subunit